MTHSLISQAVFDEVGDTGVQQHSSRYLIVAGVVCDDLIFLRRTISQVRKQMGRKARALSEIKAARLARKTPHIIIKVLDRITTLNVEVYAAVLDKQTAIANISSEDWYRRLYSHCISQVLKNHAGLYVLMDRRYTKASLQEELTTVITTAQLSNTTLTLVAADSQAEPALQVADIVAWSIFQKYEHRVEEYYSSMQSCIISEVLYRV